MSLTRFNEYEISITSLLQFADFLAGRTKPHGQFGLCNIHGNDRLRGRQSVPGYALCSGPSGRSEMEGTSLAPDLVNCSISQRFWAYLPGNFSVVAQHG